jgi:hypothetical protein
MQFVIVGAVLAVQENNRLPSSTLSIAPIPNAKVSMHCGHVEKSVYSFITPGRLVSAVGAIITQMMA